MKVYSIMSYGFDELIYRRCLEIEFRENNIQFIREHEIPVCYDNKQVGICKVDFFVENVIMVELKAVSSLEDIHIVQTLNCLEAYNAEVGLLLNFGSKSLEYRSFNKKLEQNLIRDYSVLFNASIRIIPAF